MLQLLSFITCSITSKHIGRKFATDATKLNATDGCISQQYAYTGGRYRKTRGSVITLISNIYTSFTTGPWPPVTRGPPAQLSALVTLCTCSLLHLGARSEMLASDHKLIDRSITRRQASPNSSRSI